MSGTATAEQPERPDLAVLLADETVWTAEDWRRVIAFAQSGGRPDGLKQPQPRRTWTGEAKAAYDQFVVEAGMVREQQAPDFWVSRAQAAAAIASAEQARIGNLIAWKALQAARAGSAPDVLTPGGGDAVTEEIEEGLGIA